MPELTNLQNQIVALRIRIAEKRQRHESVAVLEARHIQLTAKQLRAELRAERKRGRAA